MAQHANHWIFGKNIHLEFRGDSIIQHPISNVKQLEGTATYSDSFGKLLYYVPNDTIYRSDNSTITPPIYAHESATQGVIILKHTDSKAINFLTSNPVGSCRHSIILNDTFLLYRKRFPLLGGEKQQAVSHQNQRDIWYANHAQKGDSLYFFLHQQDGLLECPVVTHTGNDYYGDLGVATQGQMKFSPDGKLLAEATYTRPFSVGIYRFDDEYPETDSVYVLSKDFKPPYTKRWMGSIEFSPDNSFVYVNSGINDSQEPDPPIIYQLNLASLDKDTLGSTWVGIDSLWGLDNGDLQLAPNGKIYLAIPGKAYMAVINEPNKAGSACNYQRVGLTLDSGTYCLYGMPNFNQSYFYHPSVEFAYKEDCYSHQYRFWASDSFQATSYQWRFTNLANGVQQTASGKNITHTFSANGNLENKFEVRLIANNTSRSDTITKVLTLRPKLVPNFLGNDTFYCKGDKVQITLQTPDDLHCIHWNGLEPYSDFHGDTIFGYEHFHDPTYHVDTAGTYTVRITNKTFCKAYDTITVTEKDLPNKPTITENTKELESSIKAASYRWFVNDTLVGESSANTHTPTKNGYFQVQLVSSYGCLSQRSDSFFYDKAGIEQTVITRFQIYPNPSDGKITIQFNKSDTYHIEVFDMTGRLIQNLTSNHQPGQSLVLNHSGNFVIKISNSDGIVGQQVVHVR